MTLKHLYITILSALLLWPLAATADEAHDVEAPSDIDTVVQVDRIQVTAIKQGMVLRSQPVAATVVGSRTLRRAGINALKDVSEMVPNFFIPDYGSRITSSLYVRGLGARIDQPVMGMNVDNVPIMNKNNYDFDMIDAERIEILRGPQSTLYGRNTMGGVINVYTLSPLTYQGVRLGMEYGSGNTLRLRASTYNKLNENLGIAAGLYYTQSDGFFDNLATGQKCDWEKMGGARFKLQWDGLKGVRIENTASFSMLRQGGYPYAWVETGEINYNDPCSYDRINFSDGLTVRYDATAFTVSSITSYQYSDDDMILDQDFLPLSYFTLRQSLREHTVTEDIVFRSRSRGHYNWLFGAFGFYKHGSMEAPVLFKKEGIDELILKNANLHDPEYTYESFDNDQLLLDSDFRMPTSGAAIYHESNVTVGHWRFTAGLRLDYEHARLHYSSRTNTGYTATNSEGTTGHYPVKIGLRNSLKQDFMELLPKFSVIYTFDEMHNLYISASKGYKAGGFNTQMFSDVLQQAMMKQMAGIGSAYDVNQIVTYKPEYSWNYELGGHFTCMQGTVRGDFALFWIECRDQQLTVFPGGTTTGRMMTNAGRTRSMGAELMLDASPWRHFDVGLSYGYTHATFRNYHNGREDFRGNRIPYAPEHTASLRAAWTIPTGVEWLGNVVLTAAARGVGRIWWDEQNSLMQPFYVLFEASAGIEHTHYSLRLWGRNLGGAQYDTFHFQSIGNSFLQHGRPRTIGITLNINI